jgi:hypothetical protein
MPAHNRDLDSTTGDRLQTLDVRVAVLRIDHDFCHLVEPDTRASQNLDPSTIDQVAVYVLDEQQGPFE